MHVCEVARPESATHPPSAPLRAATASRATHHLVAAAVAAAAAVATAGPERARRRAIAPAIPRPPHPTLPRLRPPCAVCRGNSPARSLELGRSAAEIRHQKARTARRRGVGSYCSPKVSCRSAGTRRNDTSRRKKDDRGRRGRARVLCQGHCRVSAGVFRWRHHGGSARAGRPFQVLGASVRRWGRVNRRWRWHWATTPASAAASAPRRAATRAACAWRQRASERVRVRRSRRRFRRHERRWSTSAAKRLPRASSSRCGSRDTEKRT